MSTVPPLQTLVSALLSLSRQNPRSWVAPASVVLALTGLAQTLLAAGPAFELGDRRELFLDYKLIQSMSNAALVLQTPKDEGVTFRFNQPWEGLASAYVTVIQEGSLYRLYYRGQPTENVADSSTCYAESTNGVDWVRPNLGLHEVQGTRSNNVILRASDRSDSFAPFLDANPMAPAAARYKATASGSGTLVGYTSPDGIHWTNTAGTIFSGFAFDSLNVAFWSEAEQQYVCYFRAWIGGIRRIGRGVSPDFEKFTSEGVMDYSYPNGGAPTNYQHHYVNGTHPYRRGPHHYIALAANLYGTGGETDALYMSSRPGSMIYDRLFPDRYIVPDPRLAPEIIRSHFPAENTVQTGPKELSLYLTHKYRTAENHLRRYSLRLDGFVAVSATNGIGELLTKPLTFSGNLLKLNYRTRPDGSVRVEIRHADGGVIPGFSLADAVPLMGDEIEGAVAWRSGLSVATLAGKPVQVRFVLDNADLFAMQFSSIIHNLPPTNIGEISATLNGVLDSNAMVHVFWAAEPNGTNGVWPDCRDLGQRSTGAVTYDLTGLQPDSRYACTFGVSNASWTILAAPPQVFATAFGPQHAPADLVATPATKSSIRLRWTDRSQTESGFRIERSQGGGPWVLDQVTSAGITQAVSAGLLSGTHYDYRVRAVNRWHVSAWSDTGGAETPVVRGHSMLYTGERDTTTALDCLVDDGAQNGSLVNNVSVSSTNPRFGKKVYSFTGTGRGHVIDIPGSAGLGTSFTLAAYIDTADPKKLQRLFSSYRGSGTVLTNELVFDVDPDNSSADLGARLILNGVQLRKALPLAARDGGYHHYAVTYTNGAVVFYFDGTPLHTGTAGSGGVELGSDMRFGEDFGGTADENFIGDADEILVLRRALAANEIGELFRAGAESLLDLADSDVDGIPDSWEAKYGGTDLFASGRDYDLDGMDDDEERIAGTDPTDAGSLLRLSIAELSGSSASVKWPSASNRWYGVESSSDLSAGFTAVAGALPATPPTNIYSFGLTGIDPMYLRVSVTGEQ